MSPVQSESALTPAPSASTRAREYVCTFCQKIFTSFTEWCPACGEEGALYEIAKNKARRGRGFVRASDWEKDDLDAFPAGDWKEVFPNGIPGRTIILFRGRAGSGKTRLAIKLAAQIGNAGIISLENPTDDVVRMAEGVGVPLEDLLISDAEWSENTLRTAARAGIEALVVDSLQKLGARPEREYDAIKGFAREREGGRVVIVISQTNAKGGTRGGLSAEFDLGEVVAEVSATDKPGIALVTIAQKNRYGPLGRFEAALVPGRSRLKMLK